LFIGVSGVLLYSGQYFIDRQRRGPFLYLFGACALFVAIVFGLIMIAMAILSLTIFLKVTRSLEDRAVRIFKERVSVYIVSLIFITKVYSICYDYGSNLSIFLNGFDFIFYANYHWKRYFFDTTLYATIKLLCFAFYCQFFDVRFEFVSNFNLEKKFIFWNVS